jgi:hypothetical protein
LKRFWLAALCLASASLGAQDLLYAQRGNPSALLVNPAADLDARIWLALPSLHANLQASFAAGDVLGDDLGTLWRQFPSESAGIRSQTDLNLFSMGFKAKKTTLWLGASLNLDAGILLDRDLVGFALWGMKDTSGQVDLNYDGNFSQTSSILSARSNLHFGIQREFKKLRLGATLNASQMLAQAQLGFDSLGLRSTDRGNGFNDLLLYSQGGLALSTNPGVGLDIFNGTLDFDAQEALSNSLWSLDLGGSYDASKRWRLAASLQGIPLGTMAIEQDSALRFDGRIPFSGFSYNSGIDTSLNPGAYFDSLLFQVRSLAQGSPVGLTSFSPIRRVDLAAYWRSPKKTHQLGLHYLARSRPALSFQALAAEYHGFYGRRLQLSASYTQPLTGSVAMRPSVSVQTTLRLAAGLALNFGTSSVNMLPQPVTTANGTLTVGLPANLDRLNVNVGLHWMLYEKSYRKNAKERSATKKVKRAAKKANRATKTN